MNFTIYMYEKKVRSTVASSPLTDGVFDGTEDAQMWMSHGDKVCVNTDIYNLSDITHQLIKIDILCMFVCICVCDIQHTTDMMYLLC
jgi:hypothetical protein